MRFKKDKKHGKETDPGKKNDKIMLIYKLTYCTPLFFCAREDYEFEDLIFFFFYLVRYSSGVKTQEA